MNWAFSLKTQSATISKMPTVNPKTSYKQFLEECPFYVFPNKFRSPDVRKVLGYRAGAFSLSVQRKVTWPFRKRMSTQSRSHSSTVKVKML
jgi:hypothetical protein